MMLAKLDFLRPYVQRRCTQETAVPNVSISAIDIIICDGGREDKILSTYGMSFLLCLKLIDS